jgi:hypothetical protein
MCLVCGQYHGSLQLHCHYYWPVRFLPQAGFQKINTDFIYLLGEQMDKFIAQRDQ